MVMTQRKTRRNLKSIALRLFYRVATVLDKYLGEGEGGSVI